MTGIVVEPGFNDIVRLMVFGSIPLCRKKKSTDTYRKSNPCSCTINNGMGGGHSAKAADRVSLFDLIILILIVANTIVIVFDLWQRGNGAVATDPVVSATQNVFLVLFTIEALMKMFAYGSPNNKCCRLGMHAYFT